MFRGQVEILAFTAEQVCRLTGLSKRQLAYWDRTSFFSPGHERGRGAFARLYTFRDLVGLRTIAILRKDRKIPLQELRRVGEWLSRSFDTPWSSLTFFVDGRSVAFRDPATDIVAEARDPGQTLIVIGLEPIARDMETQTSRLRARGPADIGHLSRRRNIAHNAQVVAGTRIPTRAIWDFHQAGYSDKQILAEYPRLVAADVAAALAFERKKRKKVG